MATSSFVQWGSSRLSIRTTGVSKVVALINLPSPIYRPVWVIRFSELPKYSRSPGCQIPPRDRRHPGPLGLRLRIARHMNAPAAAQHLRESRAIVAEARCASPRIRQPQEAPAEGDHLGNRQRLHVETKVAGLHPAGTVVRQPDLNPFTVIGRLGDHFQLRFEGHGQQRSVTRDAGSR